jgi:hypothetical protein
LQQVLLVFVCVSGASLYAMPANEYAKNYGSPLAGDTLLARQINYIGGTCIPALVVLYNATDIFFAIRRNESIPEELKDLLNFPLSDTQKKLEDAGIFLGSAISAVPLMMVSFAYPLPLPINPIVSKISMGSIIEIDNTVLHFLPLKLAMMYPIYRLPILPVEWLIKVCREKKIELPNEEAEMIRRAIINFLQRAQNSLLLKKSRFKIYYYEWKFEKENIVSLQDLIEEFPIDNFILASSRSKIHDGLGMLSGVLVAGWVWSSCIGYLASTFNQTFTWMGESLGWTLAIVALPLYFMTVLLTFLGYGAGKEQYEFITNWGPQVPKLPLEFKLYPKVFTLVMAFNIYIALYSYAAAEELIRDNFKVAIWDGMRDPLIWLCRSGVSYFGLFAIKEFTKTILRKIAIHWGQGDTQMAAKVMMELEQLMSVMALVKPEVLIESKQSLEDKGILKERNFSEETEETALIPKLKRPQGMCEWLTSKCCFWRTAQSSPKIVPRNLLIAPTRNDNGYVRI